MSDAQKLEEYQRTLEEAGRQVRYDLEEALKIQADPVKAVQERERTVRESLDRARVYYRNKEYTRAFVEWDRACLAMGAADEFKAKLRALKDSHENLNRVNRELAETRQALSQRAAPQASDDRFVDSSREAVTGQVKNVYSYLSQQIRTERTPKTLNFWWPVGIAVAVLGIGFAGLTVYHQALSKKMWQPSIPVPVVSAPQPEAAQAAPGVDDAFLEAQKNAAAQQIVVLTQRHEATVEELKRKHLDAQKADREKVVQLETRVRELESELSRLHRTLETLA
jgi:hypothetical protein